MISSEALEGVPLLVLANKQDVPVLYDLSFIASMFRLLKMSFKNAGGSVCLCLNHRSSETFCDSSFSPFRFWSCVCNHHHHYYIFRPVNNNCFSLEISLLISFIV